MTATRSLSASLQHLDRVLRADGAAELPDAELVGRFVERRDEAAFTALVRRHGPMVFGVCRRVLRHEQDAEDAFQATFLVLARKAVGLRRAGGVGNWLYGVAYNVARKAKTRRRRRAVKEQEAPPRPDAPAVVADDLREVLDGELHALPDKYRAAVVLCDLMGLTIRDAAAEVGCPPKTLGTRLGRGRTLLAGRLTRRGVAVGAGAIPAALAPGATAAVPPHLLAATVRHAIGLTTGAAAVPAAVLALTKGVSNVMLAKSLQYVAVLAGGVLVLGGVGVELHRPAQATTAAGSADGGSPGRRAVPPARPFDLLDTLHRILVHALHGGGKNREVGAAAADDKKDDRPVLSGAWLRKDGEQKLEFKDKETLTISPHNKDDIILVVCSYTADKDGLVKGKITALEGSRADAAKDKLPVGTEFSFKWQAKADKATLEDLKCEKIEALKSLLEGDYEKK